MGRSAAMLSLVLLTACAQGGGGMDGIDAGRDVRQDAAPSVDPDAGMMIMPRPRDSGPPVRPDAGGEACTDTCTLPNASASCFEGACVIDACDPGYGDCDGDASTGCETALDSSAHCGACGMACAPANASAACVEGMCAVDACNPGFADCNGAPSDGCETELGTTTNCGACGDTCASGSDCVGGACSTTSCPAGTSECDADPTVACEVDHAGYVNSCAAPEDLGSAPGDLACGFLCPSASWRTLATRRGNTGKWFRARVTEASSCCADVYHCFTLTVPAGVDYDLLAYSSCGALLGSLPEGPGVTEELCVYRTDDCLGVDDAFDYWLEVRHRSGASCFEWQLTAEQTDC